MKTGRTLNELVAELERQHGAKADFIAPAKGMRMQEDGSTFEINHLQTREKQEFNASNILHRQIGSTLNIPAKYYDLMREEKPDLLARNVNAWFGDLDNNFMVRSFQFPDESIGRALLSAQYRRIDNLLVAEGVLPMFAGTDQFEVMSCEVTERKMYIKIVNHKLQKAVKPGDVVEGGVVITNSEVGMGAVSVQPFVNRLVCTNGMVVNEMGDRKTHVGRVVQPIEGSMQILSTETIEAEDKAFILRLRDATKVAFNDAMFDRVVRKLQQSEGQKLTGDPGEVVRLAGKVYDINGKEQTGILRHLVEGGDLSKYGLANAITRTSADIKDYDRATDFEEIGWKAATMDDGLWAQVNGDAYMI